MTTWTNKTQAGFKMQMLKLPFKKVLLSGAATMMLSALSAGHALAGSVAADATQVAVSNRLNDLLSSTKSLTANFTQTTKTSKNRALAKPQAAPNHLAISSMNKNFSGSMMVERPSKFRWETVKPAKQLIVANADTLWIYDPDLEQATQQMVDAQVANTPALLLSGKPETIAKNFKIVQPNAGKDTFVLYPKSDDAVFEHLAIAFVDGVPRSMVLADALGQVTTIKFTSVKVNPKLSNSLFSFKPPKGVDVIYQ